MQFRKTFASTNNYRQSCRNFARTKTNLRPRRSTCWVMRSSTPQRWSVRLLIEVEVCEDPFPCPRTRVYRHRRRRRSKTVRKVFPRSSDQRVRDINGVGWDWPLHKKSPGCTAEKIVVISEYEQGITLHAHPSTRVTDTKQIDAA